MRFSLTLTRALFTSVTIFSALIVTSGDEPACTPTGTHLSDTFSGACPDLESHNITNIGKDSHFNVNWPDGYVDGLTARGSGQCAVHLPCGVFRRPGHTVCWPAFHQPQATTTGQFTILVENKVAQVEHHDCPDIAPDTRVYCNTAEQITFEKSHRCPQEEGGEACELPICDAPFHTDIGQCCCANDYGSCEGSPILMDIDGNGFALTAPSGGVRFDVNSDGTSEKTAWTATGADDAWLVLDRNGNGRIDDGREMFGNFTFQPAPPVGSIRNGFLALAEYDKTVNGGNGDGLITNLDSVFSSLRLWQDRNHNGISETGELFGLSASGLSSLELNYHESKRTDEHGNQFMFRAKVKDSQGNNIGRWAWDVFLLSQP
jgi:hypothetical protein